MIRARYSILTDESEEREDKVVLSIYPRATRVNMSDCEVVWRDGEKIVASSYPKKKVFQLMVDCPTRLHKIVSDMNFSILDKQSIEKSCKT